MTTSSSSKSVLVVGLGIAGMSAAVRLSDMGWDVTVLEKAAERRRTGYFIGLFSTGRSAARHLGIAERLPSRDMSAASTFEIDRTTKSRRGIGYADFPGQPEFVTRDEIEQALFDELPASVRIRYATTPTSITQTLGRSNRPEKVRVATLQTNTGATDLQDYDLVIGADGLRSTVRKLAFGDDGSAVHRLGYMIAACSLPGPVPGLEMADSAILSEKGRSIWAFAYPDRTPTALFSYRSSDIDAEFRVSPIDALRRAYAPVEPGSRVDWFLQGFEHDPAPLFDTAEQVRIDRWHDGRVMLLGDAAWCLTLYSGMGATTGMSGAVLLGNMLEQHGGDIDEALDAWEERLQPFIAYHRRSGVSMRSIFTSGDTREFLSRKALGVFLQVPAVRKRLFGSSKSKDVIMKTHDITRAPVA